MIEPLPLWSPSLRATFYFPTTFASFIVFGVSWAMMPPGYMWLYFIAFMVLIFASAFTAAFGVAEVLQARYDERKFRRTIERELIK